MFKYNSKYCIMGMLSARYEVLEDWRGYRKNKKNAVSFYEDFSPDFEKVSYNYIYEKPQVKYSKSTQIVSKFDSEFFKLSGNKYREIRETRNKFDKIIINKEYNKEDVLGLIDTWDKQSGDKYGFQKHSGYDRNFFNKFYDLEKDNLISNFYYIGDKIIGYSILHKAEDCYEYLIRKVDIELRNTCLYVDYKTFEQIYEKEKEFLINWGASSGNVLKYKKKFPIFESCPVYFYSKKHI